MQNSRAAKERESLCLNIAAVQLYISIQEQKIEPADISLMRVPRNVSYGQRNKVYNSLQYRITEWLVDIQNTGTLTGEKLKKKFCSLKLNRPPDEFVIFDTRPQDFIVVSDNLTTANMNPCLRLSDAMTLHALQTDVNLKLAIYSLQCHLTFHKIRCPTEVLNLLTREKLILLYWEMACREKFGQF